MCSRFELSAASGTVAARFGLRVPPPLPEKAEIRPTDAALVIGRDGARLARWGLVPAGGGRPLINARAETLTTRPTFRRLLRSRVLIPATAWWEWRKTPGIRKRTRMRIAASGAGVFAFAGLLDGDRFTVVTCAAVPAIAGIHERMSLVLRAEGEALWLDAAADVAAALVPYDGALDSREEEGPRPPDLFGG